MAEKSTMRNREDLRYGVRYGGICKVYRKYIKGFVSRVTRKSLAHSGVAYGPVERFDLTEHVFLIILSPIRDGRGSMKNAV